MSYNFDFIASDFHIATPVFGKWKQWLYRLSLSTQMKQNAAVIMIEAKEEVRWHSKKCDGGRVYYRALVHFVHLLWVLSVFTLSDPAELSILEVPGWSTRNGEKMKWKTMVTTRTKRAPSWLRSGRGGALLAAFHKKSTFILAGLVSRVSRADLRPSLPPSG